MDHHIEPVTAHSEVEGTVWATGTPRWLRAALHIWATVVLLSAKKLSQIYADTALAHQIEQLPYSLFWIIVVLGAVSLGPYAILQHGSRRWLRSFFPDVRALQWDTTRIILSDGRVIPWADVKQIWMNRGRANSLEIFTDLWGKDGKVMLHRMLLLDPEKAYDQLKSAFVKSKTIAFEPKFQRSMKSIEAEARQNWSDAMSKTTSQLRAEGIPTTDSMAVFGYFLDKARNNKNPSTIA
jgi:hypothetical protein